MTDSTDRMSSPFRLQTSLPRARMAPSTMVSPACWHRTQHHSMHVRPAGGPGWGLWLLSRQVVRVAKRQLPATRPWPEWLPQREATILLPATSLGAGSRLGPGKLEQATWSGVRTSKPSAPLEQGRGPGTGGRNKRDVCLAALILTLTSFQKELKARQ